MVANNKQGLLLGDDPLWYKDAVIYELHVRSFRDSNGDGIGDFRGLTEKLAYLQDLGVTAVWLLPFYPSPLKDDGYDISDYTGVHPAYGTLRDFQTFLREAHRRGLRVITELVLNHISDQHPWFQRARRAKQGSRWRDFHIWSDTPERYKEARIIFKDFESSNWAWDPVAKAYYWHRFYTHQPDLNYNSPHVRKAVSGVMDFWLGMGVDSLRLDAVPYLYEREGTNCENLPETHAFLKELRDHVDRKFDNRVFLAEANQWPEDAMAYFGNQDECQMAFHFPLMPRLFMSIHMEDSFPIVDILQQTPHIPDSCQWALFLRNHDELTLEMVTDDDRDYMYRVYAQDQQARVNLGIRRRLAPLLGNHGRRIELMNGLLLSLPGTPVIYYGDEIGMGDNIYLGDRNGVRTPMQWSADRNAGFSRANPQRLYLPVITDPEYHYEAVNVEGQQNNPHSLLWWMKRLIALRKRFKAFGRGTIELLYPENRKVLAFLREYQQERILVVANLSRFVQYVELDLASFQGMVPVELFGQTRFPPIGEAPYMLSLGPHTFYWFALEPQRSEASITVSNRRTQLPLLTVVDSWENVFHGKAVTELESILPAYLKTRQWFGGKTRVIQSASIVDTIHLPNGDPQAYIAFIQVRYTEGVPEIYVLPITFTSDRQASQVTSSDVAIANLLVEGAEKNEEGVLFDALWDKGFSSTLLKTITRCRRFKGESSVITASQTRALRQLLGSEGASLEPSVVKAEQSNTSVVYGDRFILKLLRRVETGVNPDLEIGRFLAEKGDLGHMPALAGALEYCPKGNGPMTLAILHGFVQNEGDAWQYTLDALGQYFEDILAQQTEKQAVPESWRALLGLTAENIPMLPSNLIGRYLEAARLLGQRTAELHLALAKDTGDPNFSPEPFTTFYRHSLYQSVRSLVAQTFQSLRKSQRHLPETEQASAQQVLDLEGEILRRLRLVLERKIMAMRIRCHGHYHLGQVLYTGKDFLIINFEGEPARPLSERQIKRSPLRDVADMLWSFYEASHTALAGQGAGLLIRTEDSAYLRPWARFWHLWVSVSFMKSYLATASGSPILPQAQEDIQILLDIHLLEKAFYELNSELRNHPDRVIVAIRGILELMDAVN